MSLKTDYLDGVNGLTEKMALVYAAGEQFIVDNRTAIQVDLEANAAQGKKDFILTYLTAFEPDYLRLGGYHMLTYFSGIRNGLLNEQMYEQEVGIALNVSDQIDTSIDLAFTL